MYTVQCSQLAFILGELECVACFTCLRFRSSRREVWNKCVCLSLCFFPRVPVLFIHSYLFVYLGLLANSPLRDVSPAESKCGVFWDDWQFWEQPLGIKGGEAIPMLTSVTCLNKIIGFWRTDAVVQYSHWQRFSNQFIRGICVGWMQDAVRSTPVIRVCLRWWMWLGLWWKGRCQWMPQVIAALKMLLLLLFDDG